MAECVGEVNMEFANSTACSGFEPIDVDRRLRLRIRPQKLPFRRIHADGLSQQLMIHSSGQATLVVYDDYTDWNAPQKSHNLLRGLVEQGIVSTHPVTLA